MEYCARCGVYTNNIYQLGDRGYCMSCKANTGDLIEQVNNLTDAVSQLMEKNRQLQAMAQILHKGPPHEEWAQQAIWDATHILCDLYSHPNREEVDRAVVNMLAKLRKEE